MCCPIVRCPACQKYMPVKETTARKFYFIDENGEKNYIEQLYCPKCGTLVSDEARCTICNKPLSIHDTIKSEWWIGGICNECLQKTQFTPKAYNTLYGNRKLHKDRLSREKFYQEKQWFQKLHRCMRKHDMRDILIDITLGNTPEFISNSVLCADLTEGIRKMKK